MAPFCYGEACSGYLRNTRSAFCIMAPAINPAGEWLIQKAMSKKMATVETVALLIEWTVYMRKTKKPTLFL